MPNDRVILVDSANPRLPTVVKAGTVNLDDASVTDAKLATPKLDLAGGVLTGSLVIQKTAPQLFLDATGVNDHALVSFRDGGITRWSIFRDGNTGPLVFQRYDAAGAFQNNPIVIDDDTGLVTILTALIGATTFNGDVTIARTSPNLYLDATGVNDSGVIRWRDGGIDRWALYRDGGTGQLTFRRYDATGAVQDNPISLDDDTGALTLGTIASNVTVQKDSPQVILDATGTNDTGALYFKDGGVTRWALYRSGANGVLALTRYDAAGVGIDTPLQIDDDTGTVTLNNATAVTVPTPTAATHATTKAYVDGFAPATSLYLPGVAGNYATAPDSSALDVTGDIEIVARVAPTTWRPAAVQAAIGKYVATANQRAYYLGVGVGGGLVLAVSTTGSDALTYASTAAIPNDTLPRWIKATRTVSTGVANFYWAPDQPTEPTSWTVLGTPPAAQGVGVGQFASTAPIEVGAIVGGTSGIFAGRISRTIIRNGIGGTTVADWRADPMLSTYSDGYGNTFTMQGTGWEWRDSFGQRLGGPNASMTIIGTGFPEGVVTATPGTIYVDTAATNGAMEWIKRTGTGNTGWRVTYGDTGWRALTTTDLPADWRGVGSKVLLRRINNTIHFSCSSVPTTGAPPDPPSGTLVNLPSGFQVDMGAGTAELDFCGYAEATGIPTIAVVRPVITRVDVLMGARLVDGFTFVRASTTWPATNTTTANLWPATLPGAGGGG